MGCAAGRNPMLMLINNLLFLVLFIKEFGLMKGRLQLYQDYRFYFLIVTGFQIGKWWSWKWIPSTQYERHFAAPQQVLYPSGRHECVGSRVEDLCQGCHRFRLSTAWDTVFLCVFPWLTVLMSKYFMTELNKDLSLNRSSDWVLLKRLWTMWLCIIRSGSDW